MNELTESLTKEYKPKLAIVAYTAIIDDRSERDNWSNAYLESHAIDATGKLLEGKPLKQETLDSLVDVLFDERQNRLSITGLIPENLLKYEVLPGGNVEMIWYHSEQKRNLFFSEKLHIPSGEAWVPALIYHATRKELNIYAFTDAERPKENTQLYHAPFHNISESGNVCLGSARVKKEKRNTYQSLMKYWEDMFWLSEFTHLAGQEGITKTNVNTLWKKLIETETKWSSLQELKAIKNTTLKNLL